MAFVVRQSIQNQFNAFGEQFIQIFRFNRLIYLSLIHILCQICGKSFDFFPFVHSYHSIADHFQCISAIFLRIPTEKYSKHFGPINCLALRSALISVHTGLTKLIAFPRLDKSKINKSIL